MQNKLPQFEPNQVLSSEHLNQVVEYLEEQSRLTRNHLLGNGIVSGLEIRRGAASLTITEGVGVTSAGYLVMPQSDNIQTDAKGVRFITYNKKKRFAPQFLLFPYLGDTKTTANSYNLFNGFGTVAELVETAVADNIDPENVTMLAPSDLLNSVVVLFLRIQVKELKSCEADNCMEMGKQWTYSTVPLLLAKADADKLIQNERKFNPVPAADADLNPLVNPVYFLPDLVLQRPDLTNIPEDVTTELLGGRFKAAINVFRSTLTQDKCNQIDNRLKYVLKENFSPLNEFRIKLNEIQDASSVVKKPEFHQYAYDYVHDFTTAYSELQDCLFNHASFEVPDISSFPHHVRLGMVPAAENGVVNSHMYPPSAYRHGFVSSKNINEQQEVYKEAVLLFKRLVSLTRNLAIPSVPSGLRITPGNDKHKSLASNAIPFYYTLTKKEDGNDILSYWNPQAHIQNKVSRLLNYTDNFHTQNRNTPSKDPTPNMFLHSPLLVRHDDKNSYRVEGFIGASYIDTFQAVQNYITQYNLAFDLQLVRLNKATVMQIKDKHILFNDLESLYNVVCEEIKCLLTTELSYFSNVKLTRPSTKQSSPAVTNQVAANAVVEEQMQFMSISAQPQYQQTSQYFNQKANYQVKDYQVKGSMLDIMNTYAGSATLYEVPDLLLVANIALEASKPTVASGYITKLISAINDLLKVLSISFEDFSITDFNHKLAALNKETKSFILFAKNSTEATLKAENNIIKGEALDYLDRITYECDFEKIIAIDAEKTRREEQVGVNNYLQQYINLNPGLDHKAGVDKGGTLIVVFDEKGTVVADFSLPYRCCVGSGGTQFVLGVLKTIVLAGQVLDVNGVPVKTAVVTLNKEPLLLDSNAQFKKAIPPNTFLLLQATAPGFVTKEMQINAVEDDIIQNIILFTAAQEVKTNLTLTVTGPNNVALPTAVVKLDETILPLDAAGVFKGQVKANQNFALSVTLAGFKPFTQAFATTTEAKDIAVQMVKLVTISGSIVGPNQQPVTNAAVFLNGALIKSTLDKFIIKDLEGNASYTLEIEAENLEKYTEKITPNNVDVTKTFQLAPAATFAVKVGVYVSSAPVFVRGKETKDPFGLSTAAKAPETYELITEGVKSTINGKDQVAEAKTELFISQLNKAQHALAVLVKALRLSFTASVSVTERDLLILIPAKQGYKAESVFVIVPTGKEENLKVCNAFLIKQFNLKGVETVMTRSFEIHLFTELEATEFAQLMKAAGIAFTTRSQSRKSGTDTLGIK